MIHEAEDFFLFDYARKYWGVGEQLWYGMNFIFLTFLFLVLFLEARSHYAFFLMLQACSISVVSNKKDMFLFPAI